MHRHFPWSLPKGSFPDRSFLRHPLQLLRRRREGFPHVARGAKDQRGKPARSVLADLLSLEVFPSRSNRKSGVHCAVVISVKNQFTLGAFP